MPIPYRCGVTSLAATIYWHIGPYLCIYYDIIGPTEKQFKQKNTLKPLLY